MPNKFAETIRARRMAIEAETAVLRAELAAMGIDPSMSAEEIFRKNLIEILRQVDAAWLPPVREHRT